ncbi:Dph6-related ATP pyrophosphatase [Conexibacter woesei]|uniref:Diphthamide synthase domain-containing protein n=1 Tax=Conexibacter woesei (strain DSM 14684 / CCUG 47730 / CIP 108061 / JCM 11494 / NBRC 100937 / ID131577) TaxID=469383 RepID=D3FCN2_CONWI|nr:hypothetical protein [Conexibacter woesei]ADB49505.1 protein of unknown function DUF71 ATP-binding region [Conexibacter woesei DSM 14684]
MSDVVLWSGGKDCFAAALRSGALADPATRLVTAVPAGEPAAFRCHPLEWMTQQAAALQLSHELVEIPREGWEAAYRAALTALARDGVTRIVTGDLVIEPWLRSATEAAGVELVTPFAGDPDPGAVLDFIAEHDVVANVTGMRADHYRPGFLGRQAGRELLVEHGLTDPALFHPAGELGEYHTVVTRYGDLRLVDADLDALPHVERDGVWSLDRSARTSMSEIL